jgi:hypothetical protein
MEHNRDAIFYLLSCHYGNRLCSTRIHSFPHWCLAGSGSVQMLVVFWWMLSFTTVNIGKHCFISSCPHSTYDLRQWTGVGLWEGPYNTSKVQKFCWQPKLTKGSNWSQQARTSAWVSLIGPKFEIPWMTNFNPPLCGVLEPSHTQLDDWKRDVARKKINSAHPRCS